MEKKNEESAALFIGWEKRDVTYHQLESDGVFQYTSHGVLHCGRFGGSPVYVLAAVSLLGYLHTRSSDKANTGPQELGGCWLLSLSSHVCRQCRQKNKK